MIVHGSIVRQRAVFALVFSCAVAAGQTPPLTDASPGSTLLPPKSTSVRFTVRSAQPASCAYAVGSAVDYSHMSPFAEGQGETNHRTEIRGLDPDTTRVNEVYVRCTSAPDAPLHLRYRSLPSTDAPFPRVGNLWGTMQILPRGLPHAARIGLHLGAVIDRSYEGLDFDNDFLANVGRAGRVLNLDQIRQLRTLNPNILILTSVNTVENITKVPDDFYLKDTNGKRIEVWPGTYRLNLTKPKVAEYQAHFAYQQMLKLDLMVDGCFFDNFMTTMSWLRQDIHGNPVQIDADEDGRPDDPRVLDAKWREGVFNELREWRKLMPYALTLGHLPRPPDAETLEIFNGDSIGFLTARVLENANSFVDLWDEYNGWFERGRKPVVMMVESSPASQIGYGYDYHPNEKIPPSTLEFARTYFPWVRFGLALTLMNDGYFAHEFGDTWHGNDWWYDELDFNLGHPQGPAKRVFPSSKEPANLAVPGKPDQTLALTPGVRYDLSFRARSDAPRNITVTAQRRSQSKPQLYRSRQFAIGTDWAQYGFAFEGGDHAGETRIEFQLGPGPGRAQIAGLRVAQREPDVWRRDFTNGIALLNGTNQRQTIPLGPGFRRIKGEQAPRYQYIVDDLPPAFSTQGAWAPAIFDSGLWKSKGPFFHNWGAGCHQLDGAGTAEWKLNPPAADTYTIAAWWAAAPASRSWTHQAVYEIVSGGKVIASATHDQTKAGDQWHEIATVPLSPDGAPVVRLRNAGGGSLIADAIYISSASRYNDGSAAREVVLEPLDGIVLERVPPAR